MLAQSAGAATTPVFTGGLLTGASNLQTDIGAFDVTFTRGTCADVYGAGTCQFGGTPFMFTQSQALTVATALNSFMLGQDKTKLPGYTNNHTSTVYTPYGVSERFLRIGPILRPNGHGLDLYFTAFINSTAGNGLQSIQANGFGGVRLYATYTPYVAPPSAVPEPGTWLMLGLGFGVVGAVARSRAGRGVVVSRI